MKYRHFLRATFVIALATFAVGLPVHDYTSYGQLVNAIPHGELDSLGNWRPKLDPAILPPAQDMPITIFIHGGGKPISSLVSIPGFDNNCPWGMYPYLSICQGCSLGRKVAKQLNDGDAENYPLNGFYIFGWSGVLSQRDREEVGKLLYFIISEIKANPRYQNSPIRIITHSHGGNAALQIARYAAEYNDTRPLIDQLVIMGCPVLVDSSEYTLSPIFKHKTIILFSRNDPIQVFDPQWLYPVNRHPRGKKPFFSKRRFDKNDRIIQMDLRFNDKAMGHLGFVTRKFLKNLPTLIKRLQKPDGTRGLPIDDNGDYLINFNTRQEYFEAGRVRCRKRLK